MSNTTRQSSFRKAVATAIERAAVAAPAADAPEPVRAGAAGKPRVAIACQGGGSHAAFGAGVLMTLLARQHFSRFDLVGLSGTSGGAVCAALAWSGLICGAADPPAEAARRLAAFWHDLEADGVAEAVANFWGLWFARLPVTAEVSPYAYEPVAGPVLREMLAAHLDLDALPRDAARRSRPKLLIGATDILAGEGRALPGETLTYEDIIASAAIPPLYRAVETRGTLFWDGLFSRNPPVREFTDLPKGERPDEIWIVRINPHTREHEPKTMSEIVDRRSELSGNLALEQELYFITKINELIEREPGLARRYQRIVLREVALDRTDLDHASKYDRNPELIRDLIDRGRRQALRFFEPSSLCAGAAGNPMPAGLSAVAAR